MKKILGLAVLVFALIGVGVEAQTPPPATGGTTPPAQAQGRKKRVAVFDFDYATVMTNSQAIFGSNGLIENFEMMPRG